MHILISRKKICNVLASLLIVPLKMRSLFKVDVRPSSYRTFMLLYLLIYICIRIVLNGGECAMKRALMCAEILEVFVLFH